ncbi:MAG: helix-turn-helix transcriptional regulator [Thaumarchaeota archaeon]|nr:helix-turn-helix transcriptional regulator [Nitrososphaerota archaeon]
MTARKSTQIRSALELEYQADPIRESLKLLGRKWTLLIIRDIAFLKLRRFGQILKNNPGLTPRVLSRRLDQMAKEGLVKKKSIRTEGPQYYLTTKGEDAVYILLATLRFGIRHYMKKLDEKSAIDKLHYEVPEEKKWSY